MAKAEKAISGQVLEPDFEKMKRIFVRDIKQAEEKSGKAGGDLSAAWKAVEKECHCNKRAAKLLFRLQGESEETRDDFLRTLYGGMLSLGIGLSADLVDQAEGKEAPKMPVTDKPALSLVDLATTH